MDDGLNTLSPIDLTANISPSSTSILPICTKSDITPVKRKTTFLFKSPSSYPKYVIFDLIFSIGLIEDVIPVQSKNWLTVFDPYVIVFTPAITIPVVPNPIVESTFITDAPTATVSSDFVFGTTTKSFFTLDDSSYPTNNPIL